MTTVLIDALMLEGPLRELALHLGLREADAHRALDRAMAALVAGASPPEAMRVGRAELERRVLAVPA